MSAKNHVYNSQFDVIDPTTKLPKGWYFASLPAPRGLVVYSSVELATQPTLSIAIAEVHPPDVVSYNAHQEICTLRGGDSCHLKFDMQTTGLTSRPAAVLQFFEDFAAEMKDCVSTDQGRMDGNVETWQTVEQAFVVPKDAPLARLRIGFSSSGNAGGTAYITNVVVVSTA